MSDRHIYKAKRTDNGEWVEGFVARPCKSDAEKNPLTYYFNAVDELGWYTEVIVSAKTICQCTGLTDKNGKKIWENNIVRRTDLHDSKEPSVGFIEYDAENTSFLIHWTDVTNYSATYHWKDKIEVVGNIFDNPELLEVEQ